VKRNPQNYRPDTDEPAESRGGDGSHRLKRRPKRLRCFRKPEEIQRELDRERKSRERKSRQVTKGQEGPLTPDSAR
jgi:hypothetical protein